MAKDEPQRHLNWGGARPGAGRPPKGDKAGVSHLRRPKLSSDERLQVVLRLDSSIPSLRAPELRDAVSQAIAAGQDRFGFQVLEHRLRSSELQLWVRAIHRRALARGMQGLSIRIARAINGCLGRAGRVFADRYEVVEW